MVKDSSNSNRQLERLAIGTDPLMHCRRLLSIPDLD